MERLGHGGNTQALGEAAGAGDIRLDDIHRLAVEDLAEAKTGELRFAAGDWYVERTSHLRVAIKIVGRERLFKPGEVKPFQSPRELHCRSPLHAAIRIRR